VGKTEGYLALLTTYPDTPATEHTLVGVIDKFGGTRINRESSQKYLEALCLQFDTQVSGHLLQLAGAVGGAMGTVYRM